MKPLNLKSVNEYVNENIVDFHQRKLKSLSDLKLEKLLTKNPYLFRAKNLTTASELIDDLSNQFFNEYCDSNTGLIDWVKLIQFNSGNYKPQGGNRDD